MSRSSVAPLLRRIPRWVYIVLAVLLVIAALVIVPRIITQRKINAEIAALRAEGWPMTLAELDASYKYPPGANAADTLGAAFALCDETLTIRDPFFDSWPLRPAVKTLPPETNAKIAAYLAANAKALELLHKGAAIPDCRWPLHIWEPAYTATPHLGSLHQAAQMLALEAEVQAHDDKPNEAAGSIVAALRLARSLQSEPPLHSQGVRYRIQAHAASALERVLSRVSLPEMRLQELSSLAEEEEDPAAFERALAAEAGEMNQNFKSFGAIQRVGYTIDNRKQIELLLYALRGGEQRDQLRYLQFMHKVIPVAKLSSSAMIAEMSLRESEFCGVAEESKNLSFMTAISKGVPNSAVARAHGLASLRLMRAALAVERFRLAHGKLPEKLDELLPEFLPEVPADPFDDKPLRYIKRAKGYIVYSVGEDKKDDGGEQRKPGESAGPDDIPFTVER